MIVTLNEIQRACQKALFGAGVPAGLDDDAAQAAAWLEARGISALAALAEVLESCGGSALAGLDVQDARETFDAAGSSAIVLGPSLVELAATGARLKVSALRDPQYLIAYAEGLRASGWGFEIAWAGSGAVLDPAKGTALYGEWDAAMTEPHEVVLRCARGSAEGFEVALPLSRGLADLAARSRTALASGLQVPDRVWHRIQVFARRALVPASAESRARGAGSAASDNE